MSLTPVSPAPAAWDAFVAAQPRAHVLQQTAWGALKNAFGWRSMRVGLTEGNTLAGGALLLFRPLPFKLGTLAYLPMGPYSTPEASPTLWAEIETQAKRNRAAFLRWEPGIFTAGQPPVDPAAFGFRPAPQTIQPPRTIHIDLTADEDAILARMNQGTRRKIRQSLKNDIRYYEASRDEVAKFTAMMNTTGARNDFGVHDPAYYQLAYDLFVTPGDAALILAEHEGEPLAGIMVFASGKNAWYLYGASSNVKRNLMAAYGVQWTAIQWAKARGCTTYDMWGIPDEDEATLEAEFEKREDGLWGVYGFKRGWGGEVVRSLGAWDKVYNPLVYAAYRLALKLRRGSGE